MAYKGSLFEVLEVDGSVRGTLVFDAIVSEEHEINNIVTEFPVDSGFIVSDHLIRKNRILKMQVVSVRHAFAGREDTESINAGSSNKPKSDFDVLVQMAQLGLKCNVTTILGVYTNCVVRKIVTKQDVDTATILQASLIIEELNVVTEDTSSSKQALIDTEGLDDGEIANNAINNWASAGVV